MTIIQKKRILARFPIHYPLADACKIIKEWDPQVIKCGHVEGIPYVFAESKGPKFAQRVARYLKQGIIFEENAYIPKFDEDDEGEIPPMEEEHNEMNRRDTIQQLPVGTVPVNIVSNPISPELVEKIEFIYNIVRKFEGRFDLLEQIMVSLTKRFEKEIRSIGQEMTPVVPVERGISPALVGRQSVGISARNEESRPPMRGEEPRKRKSPSKSRTSPTPTPVPTPMREEPSNPKRTASTKQRVRPIIDSDEIPLSEGVEYYPMERFPNTYRKIAGINADKDRGFFISMGKNTPKEPFYTGTYGNMDRAYAAAKAFLDAKTKEGGFGTDKEIGNEWIAQYKIDHGIQ